MKAPRSICRGRVNGKNKEGPVLVESVSGMDGHYNSNEQAHNSSSEYSLAIQCPPSMNITGGIYRWRYTSHVQLLFYTLTTVIFLEYSWMYM